MPTSKTRIQWRHNTAAAFTSDNPVLSSAEAAYETDTGKVKIGDGILDWVHLGYFGGGGGGSPSGAAGSVQFTDGADFSSDNDNFFWDNAGKKLGIGTKTPFFNLEVAGTAPIVNRVCSDTITYGAGLTVFRSKGTVASPTPIDVADVNMGGVGVRGYYGGGTPGWSATGRGGMSVLSAAAWTETSHGTYLVFRTTSIGSTTNTERVRISDAGYVGISTLAPAFPLDVVGNINTSGKYLVGSVSALAVLSGVSSFAVGLRAGEANTTGSYNTFVGTQAGLNNTDGQYNTFTGFSAGASNAGGTNNAFYGALAGVSSVVGTENAYFGYQAGTNSTGNCNAFFGANVGVTNTTGSNNSFFGRQAGFNSSADNNTFLGYGSGANTTSGGNNTFVGLGSGGTNVVGANNTCVGYASGVVVDGLTNATAIGYNAQVGASNSLVLGSAGVKVGIGVATPGWTLDVYGSTIGIKSFSDTAGIGASIECARARGTATAPTEINAADINIMSVRGIGYYGGGTPGWCTGGRVSMGGFSAEAWTATAQGTYLTFKTTSIGSTANTERVRISDSGNVGIGTSTPTSRLHVVGSIKMVDGNQAAGRVLTSNADGLGSWAAAPGGSKSINLSVTGGFQYKYPFFLISSPDTGPLNPTSPYDLVESGVGITRFSYVEQVGITPVITSLSFNDLESVEGDFNPTLPSITSLSAPALTVIGGNFSPSLASGGSLSFPALEIVGGIFQLNAPLTSLDLSALTRVEGTFGFALADALTSVDFSSLTFVGGNAQIAAAMSALSSLDISALAIVRGTLMVTTLPSLATLSAPALTYAGEGSYCMSVDTMSGLTTLSLPALVIANGQFNCTYLVPSLANLTFGTVGTLKDLNGDFMAADLALTQASVDQILEVIASLDGTGGTTSWGAGRTLTLNGGTSSAPSAAGLVNKGIIEARGATVLVNP